MSAYVPFDSLHWASNKRTSTDRKPVLTASSEIDGTSLLGLDPLIIRWQASQIQQVPSQNQTNA
jgi:hypothetical protein